MSLATPPLAPTPGSGSSAAPSAFGKFVSGVGVVLGLELRQRVRGTAWYILIGIFVLLVAIVTAVVWLVTGAWGMDAGSNGAGAFSSIIYFVLLLGTLVAPALSGNAINGDRDAGTLATTQVTLVTTWQIIVGKFLAAWITALAFLVASVPFLGITIIQGVPLDTILASIVVLALELGVIAAVGVGLSGLVQRPLFSIVLTYLFVAALSIGTLITFGLGGLAIRSEVTYSNSYADSYDQNTGVGINCDDPEVYTDETPRFDYFWGVLAANPYVLLADAVPTHYNEEGYPDDVFGSIKLGVRSTQLPPDLTAGYDECAPTSFTDDYEDPQTVIDRTVPGWFVGLVIHLVLAGGALAGAAAKLKTPARRLGAGSRIA